MNVDFFESTKPRSELVVIAAKLPFSTTIYLAAENIAEFKDGERCLKEANEKIEVGWWPMMPAASSFWISPFSYHKELKQLWCELQWYDDHQFKVMLDLELPILKPWMFLRNLPHFFSNRRIIQEILKWGQRERREILTAEYPAIGTLTARLMRLLGISYPTDRHDHVRIPMCYESQMEDHDRKIQGSFVYRTLCRFLFGPKFSLEDSVNQWLRSEAAANPGKLHVGVGVTTPANIWDSTSIIEPAALSDYLRFLQSLGIDTAVVYQLSGMTEEHIAVCNDFAGVTEEAIEVER